jgi:hypothetical protein
VQLPSPSFRPHFERIRTFGVRVSPGPASLVVLHYRFSPYDIRLIQVVGVVLEYPSYDAGPSTIVGRPSASTPVPVPRLAGGLETFHRALKDSFGGRPQDGAAGVTPQISVLQRNSMCVSYRNHPVAHGSMIEMPRTIPATQSRTTRRQTRTDPVAQTSAEPKGLPRHPTTRPTEWP